MDIAQQRVGSLDGGPSSTAVLGDTSDLSSLRRRTFAIISHPDAGKTTLTEHFLQASGAVREAGEVKSRGDQRGARSDWMAIEQQRGISVTSSVMTFQQGDILFNLLDTPGHQDFSEDTYRTLTAVDCAVMVIDAAKGIETQTRKLFEVCRNRNVPIVTFINKVDREGKSPFELIDEIAETLQLDVSPQNWPTGMGGLFHGLYDFGSNELLTIDRSDGLSAGPSFPFSGVDDPRLSEVIPAEVAAALAEEGGIAQSLYPAFNRPAFDNGDLTPAYFGSALKSIGVRQILEGLSAFAPPPQPQPALPAAVDPSEPRVTGFIFKVQANMDPNHRDRVAFMRICSGTMTRGMKLLNSRTQKALGLHNPITFFARDRELAGTALPGDIIGIPNHGTLRVGDTLSEKGDVRFTGLPDFAPEILRRVRMTDPLKVKQARRGLGDLAEEGVIRLFKPSVGSQWVVGVIGSLQLDVLATRLQQEYGVSVEFESSPHEIARWIKADDAREVDRLRSAYRPQMAEDNDGENILLIRNAWELGRLLQEWPSIQFLSVRERLG